MELMIRQRFSLTDSYHVFDPQGNIRYDVEDELFSWGHQMHVYDHRTGREIGSVHQKFFTFTPEFEIVIGGVLKGTIRKEFTFFVPRYQVDYLGWDIEGDLLGWDYRVTHGNREVISISKELFRFTDTYRIRFADPADEIPGLMLVIAIDAVNYSKK